MTTPTTSLPAWLQPALAQALTQARGHALLVHGAPGSGQFELALALARSWLCESTPADAPPHQPACGRCVSCHLVDARAHPDLMVLLPEALELSLGWRHAPDDDGDKASKSRKPSQELKVEAIRQAVNFAQHTSSRGRCKVVLVHPAERMNTVSANTLLKTLEEPPGVVRFVLSAQGSVDSLLPTIRSRCQLWHLGMPPSQDALRWLQSQQEGLSDDEATTLLAAAGGQPWTALDLAQQGLRASAWRQLPSQLSKGDSSGLAGWPVSWVVETLLKLCQDMSAHAVGGTPRFFAAAELPAPPDLAVLGQWHKQLMLVARHADHPWHANLRLESLVEQAAAVLRRGKPSRQG
ncbi:DNA polymerase III subunit delta' [Aquabacterium sp. A3]|uniref:DNA polymerase III subunit delta' n=1 Tax=Aquabacterium sp. A3 TaxID=3132829 RepID=UPI0031191D1F